MDEEEVMREKLILSMNTMEKLPYTEHYDQLQTLLIRLRFNGYQSAMGESTEGDIDKIMIEIGETLDALVRESIQLSI